MPVSNKSEIRSTKFETRQADEVAVRVSDFGFRVSDFDSGGRAEQGCPEGGGAAESQFDVVGQGDIDQGLADYPDAAFDFVILSQTLQEMRYPLRVLTQMLRVGRRTIVSFPNFGHWSVRVAHLFSGRAPRTASGRPG